jgi:signal transduction histidine kinase
VLLVSLVPLGLLGGGLLFLHWQAQERQREESQMQTARMLSENIDNAVESSVRRLQIFAALWGSSDTTEHEVYELAKAALAQNPDWSNILAYAADGLPVFRLDQPYGSAPSGTRLMPFFQPVLQERRPAVSDIFDSRARNVKIVSVAVPVLHEGKATHVLIASLNLHWFDELLRTHQPDGGIAAILDRNLRFIARGGAADARRGLAPSAGFADPVRARSEGIGRFSSLENVAVYTAWSRTKAGWTVGYAQPAAPIDGAFWRHLLLYCGLWLAAVAASVALAVSKGRPIAKSLASLERSAVQLARGNPLAPLPASNVAEIDKALTCLEAASGALSLAMHEREQSLAAERDARAVAEAASRAKDEFLAMLGHELRNPLAAISNSATILRLGLDDAGQAEFAAGVITRQSAHLKHLIDDLLDVGRVVTGKIVLSRAPLELAAAVRLALTSLETAGRLADRRVELRAEPVWIDGDATRIEQIVANLVINAATYTGAGGRIGIEVGGDEGGALLRVIDDGRGIEPQQLARVFELFYQGETGPERANGGLGVGLTLVQRLVELHGGSVRASSDGRGMGAIFEVRIPATASPQRVDGRCAAGALSR